jgi:hypothetical protein
LALSNRLRFFILALSKRLRFFYFGTVEETKIFILALLKSLRFFILRPIFELKQFVFCNKILSKGIMFLMMVLLKRLFDFHFNNLEETIFLNSSSVWHCRDTKSFYFGTVEKTKSFYFGTVE